MQTRLATDAPALPDVKPAEETRPDTRPSTGDGDHDRFAHYVDKNESARAYVEGTPVRALCGKIWVPSRDPSRYPVCPTCQEIVDAIFGKDDQGEGGDG